VTISLTLQVARVKLRIWRLLATRVAWRTVRRAMQWMGPAG